MELKSQVIIDELSKRVQSLTMENIILSSQVAQLVSELSELNSRLNQPSAEPQQ